MSDYNQYCSDCSHREEHTPRVKPRVDPMKDQKHHGNLEHMGELGAVSAGGFALWEKHRADKDPEHARRHRLEEEAAAVGALGAGGYAFHEHHQKKGAYDQGHQHLYN